MDLHKYLLIFIVLCCNATILSQETYHHSIREEQAIYYKNLGHSYPYYEQNNQPSSTLSFPKSNCALDKVVFGWHPYWSNGLEVNYQWDLLSDLCYFSYEVDPNTGNPISTHGFSTANVIDEALSHNVNVSLCVTLFGSHATFFNNIAAQQNLINNLISLCQSRGATGINIDFEGMPSSQKNNFTSFIGSLSTQFKSTIVDGKISIALYAVDWGDVFDIPALVSSVDYFCIMGYDYYWSGSTQAGPTDPLYRFENSNYTLSRSVTNYLDKGVPKSKLVLGLPYYGKFWPVSNFTLPASTSGSGGSIFYSDVKDNINGNFIPANRNEYNPSHSVYYNYTDGSTKYQCFITEGKGMKKRLQFIRKRGIAGMGIWALGYDDGYPEFWNAIKTTLTDCYEDPCADTLADIGGGIYGSYFNNEDYQFTIEPSGAEQIQVNFLSFDVEQNYDYLYIYDGPSSSSPQVTGSPFTGVSVPPSIISSGGAITFQFISDGATTAPGFTGTYQCLAPPISLIDTLQLWQTNDFAQYFYDSSPNGMVENRYYNVLYKKEGKWKANKTKGFLSYPFNATQIHPDWIINDGNWTENGALHQSDETLSNTNIYTSLNQSGANGFLYNWKGKMGGSGTNRRAGLHICIAGDPTLPNRELSYFAYFRVDDDKIQFYKVENDNFGTPLINTAFNFNPNQWYDYKISFNRVTGVIKIYIDNVLVGNWTDSTPINNGTFVSFRTGNSTYDVKDFMVFRSRASVVNISVGSEVSNDIRTQNPNPNTPSGLITSVITNDNGNVSNIDTFFTNIDWTAPILDYINDGNATFDKDTALFIGYATAFTAFWNVKDTNSGILNYTYALGTVPYNDNIVPWTNLGNVNSVLVSNIGLVDNTKYYVTVKAINGAGIEGSYAADGIQFLTHASTNEQQLIRYNIFPNPAKKYLFIQAKQPITNFTIYNMLGRKILSNTTDQTKIFINIQNLTAGIYLLKITINNRTFVKKWIKR